MRKRSAAASSPNAAPARTAMSWRSSSASASCAPVSTPRAPAPARGRGRGRSRPDGGRHSAPAATTCSWAAAVTSRCRRRLRATCSRTSSGSSRTCAAACCIGAARHDQSSLARPVSARRASAPSGAVGEPREADAPAAEGHALAQPVGHEGALRRQLGRAAERVGIVGEVAVDLVGNDQEVLLARRSRRPPAPARARRACRSGCPAASARGCRDAARRRGRRRAPRGARPGSGTPPACAGIGTSITRLPASAACAA